jgi:hypothetical protein
MKYIIFLLTLLSVCTTHAQPCEQFDRKLFHALRPEVPDNINCRDSLDRKQGWWIDYKIDYNSTFLPDELDTGYYVDQYTYGQYKNDQKTGRWITVNNVHMIYESKVDSFYNTGKVAGVWSKRPREKSFLEYSTDSIFINALYIEERDTVYFSCDKRRPKKECACETRYHGKTVKQFPLADFDIEFMVAYFYTRKW